MRELKFRAWDKEEKEYYYNAEHTYDFFCSGRGCYAESFGEVLNQPDRFIVEQYTGLKDKNGREIYEGDIMIINGDRCVVVWDDNYASFEFKNLDDPVFHPVFHKTMSCGGHEVIGNIHENPELLGGRK